MRTILAEHEAKVVVMQRLGVKEYKYLVLRTLTTIGCCVCRNMLHNGDAVRFTLLEEEWELINDKYYLFCRERNCKELYEITLAIRRDS